MRVVRIAAVLLGFFSATLAHGIAQRTFVASTGADTNAAFNCSIVKPCRGFAAAIGVTNAAGEVIVLDSAGYGAIPSVTQSVTINAPTGIYAGISVFTGDGITINGSNIVVVLRGLTINGQGGTNGITITNASTVHIENCVVADMVNIGIRQVAGALEVKDTIVRNSGNAGIYVVGPGVANLDRVRLEANPYGLAAEFGGQVAMQDSLVTGSTSIGVVAINPVPAGSKVTISRSLISASNYGVYVDANNGNNPAIITISDSTISYNTVGIHATSEGNGGRPGHIHLTRDTITANGIGLEVSANGNAYLDDNNMLDNLQYDFTDDDTSSVQTRNNNLIANGFYMFATIIPFAPL